MLKDVLIKVVDLYGEELRHRVKKQQVKVQLIDSAIKQMIEVITRSITDANTSHGGDGPNSDESIEDARHYAVAEFMRKQREYEARAEREKQEKYVASLAEPAYRKLDDGRVFYSASSNNIILPEGVASIVLGTLQDQAGTGFPGLPETEIRHFGVGDDFTPEDVFISTGFDLVAGFVGAMSMLPQLVHGSSVPAVALWGEQPKYPLCQRGLSIFVDVKNTSDQPLPCHVMIRGRISK